MGVDHEDDEATPLPPPNRQSSLDMSVDIPAIPLAKTIASASEPSPPTVEVMPDLVPEPVAPRARTAAPKPTPDPEPDVTRHRADPPTRYLVWGAVCVIVGAIMSLGTLFGSGQPEIVIGGGLPVVGGLAAIAIGARRSPWKTSDIWLDAGALVAEEGAPWALAILTIAMVYLYSGMFNGALVGDDLSFHMAESRRIADCLSVGDLDLWNPSANGGFASAYYYQVVPQLASAIPTALFGHFLFFFQLSVFLPLVLAPVAAYRGMRLLGATPWQSLFAAAAVGLMNGESRWGTGNAGTFQVGLYTQTWALAALPMALGHTARWIKQTKGLAPAIAWGTFVWLCHPMAGISLFLIVLVYFVASGIGFGFDRLFAMAAEDMPQPSMQDGMFLRAWHGMGQRWRAPAPRNPWGHELGRAAILGACLLVAWSPVYLPLLIDKAGFGGFPHRVNDEVGPGFATFGKWWINGAVLDFGGRVSILTWLFPVALFLTRSPVFRWLWWSALLFALWLCLGPSLGTTQNDLLPAVRFLGAMQVLLALGTGVGVVLLVRAIWRAQDGSLTLWMCWLVLLVTIGIGGPLLAWWFVSAPHDAGIMNLARLVTAWQVTDLATLRIVGMGLVAVVTLIMLPVTFFKLRTPYALRTVVAAVCAATGVFMLVGHGSALRNRVRTLPEYDHNHPAELDAMIAKFETLPPGRKQVAAGAENHWWNLLTYVYARRPALLQMGGGGLQASPNYDFLWNIMRQYEKNGYLYDAPYLVYQRSSGPQMPKAEVIFATENYEVRRLPRASSLVSPITVTGMLPDGPNDANTPVRQAALDWIKSDQPEKDQMLAYEGSGPPGPAGNGKVIRSWRQDSPGDDPDIVAEVVAEKPTTFVIRESWHPRWHAYIDGVETRVRRVTPDFSAVDVGTGKHTIAMRFERPWWALACWLAWPGLTLAAWFVLRRRDRRLAGGALPVARTV